MVPATFNLHAAQVIIDDLSLLTSVNFGLHSAEQPLIIDKLTKASFTIV